MEQSIPDELRDKAVFDNKMKELSSKIETHIKQAEQIDALFRQAEKETTRLESTLHSAQKQRWMRKKPYKYSAKFSKKP